MKILGVSLGTKNGNNDTMCRVALEAAKEMGAKPFPLCVKCKKRMAEMQKRFGWPKQRRWIPRRAPKPRSDWNIDYCSGCVACSRGLVMGKGMVCTRKDDFSAFYEKLI